VGFLLNIVELRDSRFVEAIHLLSSVDNEIIYNKTNIIIILFRVQLVNKEPPGWVALVRWAHRAGEKSHQHSQKMLGLEPRSVEGFNAKVLAVIASISP